MGRVYKRDSKWYLDYSVEGNRVRQSVGEVGVLTKKDAQEILQERERTARRPADGLAQRDCLIADLQRSYLAFAQQTLRLKSFRRAQTALESILGYLSVQKVS